MINVRSIQSLTDFKRNTNRHLERLRRSRQPLVLTVNGRAELVVLDAKTYQDLMDQIDYAESVREIQLGIDSVAKHGAKPAREALRQLAEKYGLSS